MKYVNLNTCEAFKQDETVTIENSGIEVWFVKDGWNVTTPIFCSTTNANIGIMPVYTIMTEGDDVIINGDIDKDETIIIKKDEHFTLDVYKHMGSF